MRDRVLIVGGVAVFLVLFTYPLWHAAALGNPGQAAEVAACRQQAKECVAPLPYMRAAHMQLLIDWREDVVRNGVRQIHASNGKSYDVSLTRTCLGECHTTGASSATAAIAMPASPLLLLGLP